ncbi:MAG: hypothetical protein IKE43_07105 [Coriobacteriales bacterium]|nr:hypothetical protein [Coriobacteriales bacterium]
MTAKGIAGRIKHYVAVDARFNEDGSITPQAVLWDDGRRFTINATLDRRRAASLKTGGDGIRYTVRIGTTVTHLYYEDPRWFVEERVPE